MKNPSVSIVVVNWNGEKVILDCLKSIARLQYPWKDVIVVDNGSRDNSPALIKGFSERKVHLIQNKSNRGAPAARNQGMVLALEKGAQYVFCLDNDLTVDSKAIGPLLEILEKNDRIAMAGALIFHHDPPQRIFSAGHKINWTQNLVGTLGANQVWKGQFSGFWDVDYVGSGAVLIRSEYIRKLGAFDESYLGYGYEDTEYGFRANNAGFRVVCCAAAQVWHKPHSGIGRYSFRKKYIETRNAVRFIKRYGKFKHWMKYLSFVLPGFAYAVIREGFRGNMPGVIGKIRGFYDGLIDNDELVYKLLGWGPKKPKTNESKITISKRIQQVVKNKITANSLIGLFNQGITGVLWIFVLGIVGRAIGVFNFGQTLLAVSYAEIFVLLGDFGINYMTVRKTSISPDSKDFNLSALLGIKLILMIPSFLFVCGFTWFFYEKEFFILVVTACLAFSFKTVRGLLSSFYMGNQNMKHMMYSDLMHMITTALISFILVGRGFNSAFLLLWALLLGGLASTIFSFIYARSVYGLSWHRPKIENMRDYLRETMPYGLFLIGGFLYFQVDTFMLSMMKGSVAVGIYQVPFRVIYGIELIPTVLAMALFPALSKTNINSPEKSKMYIKNSLIGISLFSFLMGGMLFFLSKPFIFLLFGPQYEESYGVMKILSLIIPLRCYAHILGVSLTSFGAQQKRLNGVLWAALGNFVLNLFLIPRFSYNGAAVATIFTALILVGFYYISLKSEIKNRLEKMNDEILMKPQPVGAVGAIGEKV